jgi:hypothetical protein
LVLHSNQRPWPGYSPSRDPCAPLSRPPCLLDTIDNGPRSSHFTVYINGFPFYSVICGNLISICLLEWLTERNMAFRKIISRLGYIYPVLSLRSISCWRCVEICLVVDVPVGRGPERNEAVLDMWVEGHLYYSLHLVLLRSTYCQIYVTHFKPVPRVSVII